MRDLLHSRINLDLFKYNLKRNRGLLLIFTLLLSVTFPAIILVNFVSTSGGVIDASEIEVFMKLISLATIMLLIITPFIFFGYLNSKKSVDVFHSLAITRNDLFITFLVLSLFFVLLPFTLAYWGGFLLSYSLIGIKFDPYHLYHYGRIIMISIAVMAPSIFVIMNTGTLSDSIIYTGILSVAPFIAYGAYQLFAEANIIGFKAGRAFTLAYLSPLAGLISSFEFINLTIDGTMIASYWLLLGLVVHCFSIRLYKNWKSETSEEPFSNKQFFPLVTSLFIAILFVFLLSVNFIPNPGWRFVSIENLLIPILATYAIFLILNILKNRSINTIKLASRNYLFLFLAVMLLTSSLHYTQGFGYTYRLPKEKNIESITINGSFQGEPFATSEEFTVKNPDTIKDILGIHEEIIEYIKQDKNLFIQDAESDIKESLSIYGPIGDYGTLSLSYTMKNNEIMERSFSVPTELQHILFKLAVNEEFLLQNHPLADLNVKLDEDVEVYDSLFTERSYYDFSLRNEDFRTAVKNDLLAMDEKTYYHSEGPIQMILIYQKDWRSYQLNIDSRFQETLKYLASEDITSSEKTSNINYEVLEAKNIKDTWIGHGIPLLLQDDMYAYYEIASQTNVTVDDSLKKNLYDKHLSKEINDVLIIDTYYGRMILPIIVE